MSKKVEEDLEQVETIKLEDLEEMCKAEDEDEPKLGFGKRIKMRAHEFGEKHPKVVSALKGIGGFGVACLAGFAGASIYERLKWSKDESDDMTAFLPEETSTIDQEEFSDSSSSEG